MQIVQSKSVTENGRSHPTHTPLHNAIHNTIAYADLFDYPLTAPEIHRYLEGTPASLAEVEGALANGRFPSHKNYFMQPGREAIVASRQEREAVSQKLWPRAIKYGRIIARLPFVRMVAVTGSLAVNNAPIAADIDYLIVTENGRLWLSRAFIIALVRWAQRDGIELCPNYILAENALEFPVRNLYVAHEIAQMVPLSGWDVYQKMRQINIWANDYLPNAAGLPSTGNSSGQFTKSPFTTMAELPLRTPIGHWLEQWEMNRKIRKLQSQESQISETQFSPNICKGHFDAYNIPTMIAYQLTISNEQ